MQECWDLCIFIARCLVCKAIKFVLSKLQSIKTRSRLECYAIANQNRVTIIITFNIWHLKYNSWISHITVHINTFLFFYLHQDCWMKIKKYFYGKNTTLMWPGNRHTTYERNLHKCFETFVSAVPWQQLLTVQHLQPHHGKKTLLTQFYHLDFHRFLSSHMCISQQVLSAQSFCQKLPACNKALSQSP